ncbi:protein of unknown function (DUF3326) [Rubidibacter lacunae KORDI 51-2]|uniref:DUF3326 domain-containing protein n=1 Tax=Rubidibacter lacunae KORDI 51-2 TaxID=582515 RepID=U5DK21_9CHRO|nr:DUF3326 domain-containing protein [Rubidibacter lacunae]ERN40030.1 protein of unknown function (DUF3326) [Rubidibacter lacunae KORDI 51-2]
MAAPAPTQPPFTVLLLVPTGIGAAIGGYAGDALPVARAIAQVADCLITHPNVLNGAQLYWPLPNALYVEGYGLDRFAAGDWVLRPVTSNRIGLLLDAAIESDLRLRHLQAADAARATLGLDLTEYVITDAPLAVELRTATSGVSWGTLGNLDSLLRAAETLVKQAGATAIAVVARFPDDADSPALQDYRRGTGVDALAGAEAVISHAIVRTLQVPCAHAPALKPLPPDPDLSPRAAAEELGYTFLPCVLAGLARAPHFAALTGCRPGDLTRDCIDAIVTPATACGGSTLLSLSQTRTRAIAVAANTTQLAVAPEPLGIKATRVNSYLEAIGLLVAQRAGVATDALHPHIPPLRRLLP